MSKKLVGLFMMALVVIFLNVFCADVASAQMPVGTAPDILAQWEDVECPNGYYDIGRAAVNRNRILEDGECYVEFAFGIPGKMGYRRGFGGNQCLPKRETFIVNRASVSETGVINKGTRVDIRRCGNGFELGIVLNILNAERVEGEGCEMRFWEKKPDPPKAEAAPTSPPVSPAPPVQEPPKVETPQPAIVVGVGVKVEQPITREELEAMLKKGATPPQNNRGWWSRNWGWVAGGLVVAGAVVALGDKKDKNDNGNKPTISGIKGVAAGGRNSPPRFAGGGGGFGGAGMTAGIRVRF